MKTLGSVRSDNKAEAWDLYYTVSWLVNSVDPYILFVLIHWKFVSIKYCSSSERPSWKKLGLMNWALVDIWEEIIFVSYAVQ